MDKFQNKYRTQSTRLQKWDYGWNAAYFVTICIQDRKHFFGDIVIDSRLIANPQHESQYKMQLSEIGEIAQKYWFEIPDHFPYVKLDEFIVMPDHIHGIIIINKPRSKGMQNQTEVKKIEAKAGGFAGSKNPMLNDNLSRIIRWYKGRVSFECRKNCTGFAWLSRYYEHIIRNESEHQRIRKYIINNPSKVKT